MRRRIRLMIVVGLIATAFDVGLLKLLVGRLNVYAANAVALGVASALSYTLNRWWTFRGDPEARWVRRPRTFVGVAIGAAAIDYMVLTIGLAFALPLVAAKLVAIAATGVARWSVYRRILLGRVRRELALRFDRPPVDRPLAATVVLPAYNEASHIASTVEAVHEAMSGTYGSADYEVLVVDDGSSDETVAIAAAAGARVVSLDQNRGKGGAVRAGMLAAQGRAVVFTDADLAYSPDLLVDVTQRVEEGWDMVVGSRRHSDTDTVVQAPKIRELGGRVINLLTRIVLLGNFRDTQCGIKGFRGDIATTIFERTRLDGFAFDVEVFLIAEQDRLSLLEVPVQVRNREGSSVRIVGDTIKLLNDLAKIRRWAGAGLYAPNAAQQSVLDARSGADISPASFVTSRR